MSASMVCNDNIQVIDLAPQSYSMDSQTTACSMDFDIDNEVSATVEGTFSVDMSKQEDGTYDYSDSMSLSNFEIIVSDAGLMNPFVISIENLDFSSSIEGFPSLQGQTLDEVTLSDLPHAMSSSVSVSNFAVNGVDFLTGNPSVYGPFSANMSVSIQDIDSNDARITTRIGYDLSSLQPNRELAALLSLPETAECEVTVSGLPVDDMQQLFEDNGLNAANVSPLDSDLFIDEMLESGAVSASYDCNLDDGQGYSVEMSGTHNLTQTGMPGSGVITVQGTDELSADLMGLGQMGFMISGLFNAYAVPSDDGTSHVLEYEISEDGNLTANGQVLGPVMP
jgi:hypothetical protein